MDINLTFRNPEQETFFFNRARNSCFSGGFNNGKSYVACMKQFLFLSTFKGYRSLFYRQRYKDLKATTMQTFFKICPPEMILRHDEHDGITVLRNKSVIYWMHMDSFDEQSLRGLEINSATGDQTEEIEEGIYLIVDSRIGRWDGAVVPEKLILSTIRPEVTEEFQIKYGPTFFDDPLVKQEYINRSLWPRDAFGRARVHNFHDILVNPETQFHWVYKKFHTKSHERKKKYFYIERATDINLGDPETMEEMQSRDSEWVSKYFKGQWGISSSQIHFVHPNSIIDPDAYEQEDKEKLQRFHKLIELIREKAVIFRVLDHGDTSPTCCLWFAALAGVHLCFMEYYVPNALITSHRQNIFDITENFRTGLHEGCNDFADPQIFKKTAQKDGGFWSVSDEYLETESPYEGLPAFQWSASDNNELATRNRINELLKPSKNRKHPITNDENSPSLYFIKRSQKHWPAGCNQAISQLQSQRRELIGSENGKSIYSDDRQKDVTDHAYDPIRYYVAMHSKSLLDKKPDAPRLSFARYNKVLENKKRKVRGYGTGYRTVY